MTTLYNALLIAALVILLGLIIYALRKSEEVKKLKGAMSKLMRSFNELDEQAKLIVRTDLALNKAQEELDKRLAGLNALQRTSRMISTTLDQNEIFERIDKSFMFELGFSKNMILMLNKDKDMICRVQNGFAKEQVDRIIKHIRNDTVFLSSINEGYILSSLSSPPQKQERIREIFGTGAFILSPILSQEGIVGTLFVGNEHSASSVTEGDEELISILSNQIGQALENAQLFEKVYRSSQQLELKVQDRTKQLASALDEVKKISKTKSEFVSAVSHELRTPLTSIKGYASILMTGKVGAIPEKVKERLEKINKHSDNLVKLINDLLDISRIESGRVEMKFENCNVHGLIDNLRDLLAPQMKEKNISFELKIDSRIPDLLVDSSQFERVFINLLSNAIKFTPEGGTVTLRGQRQGGEILFEVSDTGIGISQEDMPKLFDEFYRVENEINLNVKGTGLGLSLVKHIIEAHNGKIWVTSKVNEGTTFHFTLPLAKTGGART